MQLRCVDVAYSWGGHPPVFTDVSFAATRGFTGIVGANGAGKSTLAGLITGALVPTAGRILRPAGSRTAICAQSDHEPPALAHALAHGASRDAVRLRHSLRLAPAQLERWPTLSGGERRRWHVGGALHAEPDILVLDEPTNHLDATSRVALVDTLRAWNGIGVAISHDRALLDALCDRIVRLHAGTARVYPGGFSAAREAWEADEEAARDAWQKARSREQAMRRQLAQARDDRAGAERQRSTAARMRNPGDSDSRGINAQFRADRAEATAGRAVARARAEFERRQAQRESLAPPTPAPGRLIVPWVPCPRPAVLGLTTSSHAPGTPPWRTPVHVWLGREQRLRIEGPNGAGKSYLLEQLRGACTLPVERVLYLPQDLDADADLALLRALRALPRDQHARTMTVLAALGTCADEVLGATRLSPGLTRKLSLSLAFGRNVWLLLLDEPTNHLDLPSVLAMERALAQWPGAMVLVSHDEAFAANACGRSASLRLPEGTVATQP
jgi:ATPase subunit of ABC transporter with duplicated ATPase domains